MCDPLPPLPLGLEPTLTLGRGDGCDLVLPHGSVSKVHGIVKVRGGEIYYQDEGSSNGSYHNGRRVASVRLRPGDVLTLGPYEIELCSNDEMARRNAEGTRGTKILDTRGPPGTVLAGSLRDVPLSELLQALEFHDRTGTLEVLSPELQGEIVVREGRPLAAHAGELRDREAVLALLSLDRGRFELLRDLPEDVEERMNATFTTLLIEASRRADEGESDPLGGSAA